MAERIASEAGLLDIEALFSAFPRLEFVDRQASERRFFHWDLAFADIFYGGRRSGRRQGGFDLVLGNPPWIKVEWDEGGVLGDFDPLIELRRLTATDRRRLRDGAIRDRQGLRTSYLEEYSLADGTQRYLNSVQNYPELKGVQTNLFKCFLPAAWGALHVAGVAGLLHPEGVYDDPKGGALRASLYSRLRAHFQFQNSKLIFPDIPDRALYSVNTYGPRRELPGFDHMANLFSTVTIDKSYEATGRGRVPGIKNEEGDWDTEGHASRILKVGHRELGTFAEALDAEGTPAEEARLAAVHSKELMSVMRKFADQPRRLRDLGNEYVCGAMWHETNAQHDGTVRRETRFPDGPEEWILSGPHFFVGNPLNKTPRRECKEKADYDCIDLTAIPENYLPRTNYVPACDLEEYRRRIPVVPWGRVSDRRVTHHYRVVNRKRVGPASERTLNTAIIPPRVCHIDTVIGTTFCSNDALLDFSGVTLSTALDSYLKMTAARDAHPVRLRQIPIPLFSPAMRKALHVRALGLSCLTVEYRALWESQWDSDYLASCWTKTDKRLSGSYYGADSAISQRGKVCADPPVRPSGVTLLQNTPTIRFLSASRVSISSLHQEPNLWENSSHAIQ